MSPPACAVLHLHFETVGSRITGNHRRSENHHTAVLDILSGLVVELFDDVVRALALVAFRPVLELDDDCGICGTLTGDERVAIDHLAGCDARNGAADGVHFLGGLDSAFLRCAWGHVDHGEYQTGVLVGDEGALCCRHEVDEGHDGNGYGSECGNLVAGAPRSTFLI